MARFGDEQKAAHQIGWFEPRRTLRSLRANVRYGSLADIGVEISDVRFTPESRHSSAH